MKVGETVLFLNNVVPPNIVEMLDIRELEAIDRMNRKYYGIPGYE